MVHSKGTWLSVEDLKHDDGTFLSAFVPFLDSDDCPESVKFMLKLAQQKYYKKLSKKNNQQSNPNVEEEFLSQSTENSQTTNDSQESIVNGMGIQLMRDIARQQRQNLMNAQVDDEVLYTGGPDYDWHQEGLRHLDIPNNII